MTPKQRRGHNDPSGFRNRVTRKSFQGHKPVMKRVYPAAPVAACGTRIVSIRHGQHVYRKWSGRQAHSLV